MKNNDVLYQTILQGLSPEWVRLYDKMAKRLLGAFKTWRISANPPDNVSQSLWQIQQLSIFMVHHLSELDGTLQALNSAYQKFLKDYKDAITARERALLLLDFCKQLGATSGRLKKDEAALKRWFGLDAVQDRFDFRVREDERYIVFLWHRLAPLVSLCIEQSPDSGNTQRYFAALSFSESFEKWVACHREPAQRACLETVYALVCGHRQHENWFTSPLLLRFVQRFSTDVKQPVWLQCIAIDILTEVTPRVAEDILQKRLLTAPPVDEDVFFRHHTTSLLAKLDVDSPVRASLLERFKQDDSPYVRQGLIDHLPALTEHEQRTWMTHYACHDDNPQVRASAYTVIPELFEVPALNPALSGILLSRLAEEDDAFALRVLLSELPVIYQRCSAQSAGNADALYEAWRDPLTALHQHHPLTRVRRWVAEIREQLWGVRESARAAVMIDQQLQDLHFQRTKSINPKRLPVDEEVRGRWFAWLAQERFGFDIAAGRFRTRIRAGFRMVFRLWRLVHEWRTPATNKRQFHSHVCGRAYYGLHYAQTSRLAEVSQTKVPGEPLMMAEEGGWRPYLPLLDQVLSSLDQGWPTKPVQIYTPEGITAIYPPQSLIKRLRARWQITWRYAWFANLRNWHRSQSFSADTYLAELEKLGFSFSVRGYTESAVQYPVDKRVAQFFPVLALPGVALLWQDFTDYFYSVYQNTLHQLTVFVTVLTAWFFGRHTWSVMQLRRARGAIALVIGGWGTRGKSGTERLKAALFNAMGFNIVSKSTGCEAMFTYGPAYSPLKEFFLFRPYDKASIWEQVQITSIAAKLDADIFLWECMGLTPRYITILQNQWMRDDISTITNCFPDHEDLQGPAGINIPQVMQNFIPKNACLITSEDSMCAFLASAAKRKNTRLHTVGWKEAGLITPDILARFPYEEHPYNIALVLKLADQLGVGRAFALKAMADHVVPDLGVLKAFPVSQVQGRCLYFVNGMSANERHASLENWHRTGFAETTVHTHPDTLLCTVVNNRADRVSRTGVFARMLVEDLSADYHFLIGNNLDGLQNEIDAAWARKLEQLSLKGGSGDTPLEVYERMANWLRIPTEMNEVKARLHAACRQSSDGESADAFFDRLDVDSATAAATETETETESETIAQLRQYGHRLKQQCERYQALKAKLASGSGGAEVGLEVEVEIKDQWREWFKDKLVVIDDYYASGNQVVTHIAHQIPSGLTARIMGLQNIKGTGLDFVYRWQAWDQVNTLCDQMLGADKPAAQRATKSLAEMQSFGVLDEKKVRDTLHAVRQLPIAQSELMQAELSLIEDNLNRQLAIVEQNLGSAHRAGVWAYLLQSLEAFLDAGNAVKRRKIANQLYRDLVARRISRERVIVELKKLNTAQKGGWLKVALNEQKRRLRRLLPFRFVGSN